MNAQRTAADARLDLIIAGEELARRVLWGYPRDMLQVEAERVQAFSAEWSRLTAEEVAAGLEAYTAAVEAVTAQVRRPPTVHPPHEDMEP